MKTYSLENRFFRLALTLMLLAGLTLSVTPASTTLASAQVDLIGPAGSDRFGGSVIVLPNGNIVITDSEYSMGATAHVGAIYLYNGRTGALISTLTGGTANDQVGYGGVTALTNGSYVVSSPYWNNGAATEAGAVTWCSGTAGCSGVVSASNSLVGSTTGDAVGYVTVLTNGNYVVLSPSWSNGAASNAGAVTWCSGTTGCMGALTSDNSVLGGAANGGVNLTFVYDSFNDQLVVRRPSENRVTLFKTAPNHTVYLPLILR